MTLQTDLQQAIAQVQADAALLHDIVNGDDQTVVITDGGEVKSVAKAIADIEASITANLAIITQAVTDSEAAQLAAETAQTAAESARDEALGAVGAVKVDDADTQAEQLNEKLIVSVGLEKQTNDIGGGQKQLEIRAQQRIDTATSLFLTGNYI